MDLTRRKQRERRASRPFVSFVSFLWNLHSSRSASPTFRSRTGLPPARPDRRRPQSVAGLFDVGWHGRHGPAVVDPALVSDYFNMPLTRLCLPGAAGL